ncbi:hypothetical protein BS47DRAFT_1369696, partial [Hydnum rufescens UP504]
LFTEADIYGGVSITGSVSQSHFGVAPKRRVNRIGSVWRANPLSLTFYNNGHLHNKELDEKTLTRILELKLERLKKDIACREDKLNRARNDVKDQEPFVKRGRRFWTIHNKILGVDKTLKKGGAAETKPFTDFGVFHDNLINRLKALSQIQQDFDHQVKESQMRFTDKLVQAVTILGHGKQARIRPFHLTGKFTMMYKRWINSPAGEENGWLDVNPGHAVPKAGMMGYAEQQELSNYHPHIQWQSEGGFVGLMQQRKCCVHSVEECNRYVGLDYLLATPLVPTGHEETK